jgi:hypothetical protein
MINLFVNNLNHASQHIKPSCHVSAINANKSFSQLYNEIVNPNRSKRHT